jgi:TPR repeat protein
MMLYFARRISSKQMAAVRNEAAKEADEMCALGKCAAALIPLQQAIDMGHLPSRALMAWLLTKGREGVAKDQNRAFQLVKEGTSSGCYHCQGVLACCYFEGYGCEIDDVRSLELARKSSEKGSRYGQLTLGELHFIGAGGLAQDDAQAVAFYRLAAAQGLDEAQDRVGHMYHNGQGVAQDYAEALRWYQLAAAQGHPQALYKIAEFHMCGIVVAIDVAEAICWFKRAQVAGEAFADYQLKRLGA